MKLKHDLQAHYALPAHDDQTQARGIDFLTGYASSPPRRWPELAEVEDPAARLCLLAQARIAYTDRARVGQQRGKPGGLWHWIASGQARAFFENRRDRYLRPLGLAPTLPDLASLPAYSFTLQFTFRLRKPYLSRDDTDWHILDNPVNKEKVFGLPMVAPTGWKGALRAAMRQEKGYATLKEERVDQQMMRLFGNVTDETREDAFRSGRLRFYPTFFTQTGLEVINPHPRESGAGKQPIYFECVPIGAEGAFTLLYVPFDLIGRPEDKARAELAHDLTDVAKGIRAMLTIHGFGAKTSSGFGVVSDKLVEPGQLVLKVADLHSEEPEQSQPANPQRKRKKKLRRYWKAENQLKDEFLTDNNKLISEKQYQEYIESLGQEYTKSDRQLYAKAKKWWKREGKALAEQPEKKPELETKPETVEAQWPERRFDSLEEMVEKIEVLAEQLRPGGTQ